MGSISIRTAKMIEETSKVLRIRSIRREKRITQDELASMVGCSQMDISKFERGVKFPTTEECEKIAGSLGVTQAELVGFASIPEQQKICEAENTPDDLNRALRALAASALEIRRKFGVEFVTAATWDVKDSDFLAKAEAGFTVLAGYKYDYKGRAEIWESEANE